MGWENCRLTFPGAVEILDFYHASEHVGQLAKALHEDDPAAAASCRERWCHDMNTTVPPASFPAEARAKLQTPGRMERGPTRSGRSGNQLPGKPRVSNSLRRIPGQGMVHRLGRDRSRMQNGGRSPSQAVGHVLEPDGSRKHPRTPLPRARTTLRRCLERAQEPPRPPEGQGEAMVTSPRKARRLTFLSRTPVRASRPLHLMAPPMPMAAAKNCLQASMKSGLRKKYDPEEHSFCCPGARLRRHQGTDIARHGGHHGTAGVAALPGTTFHVRPEAVPPAYWRA